MARGRIILLTGLPAGLGASTVALALADALCGMERAVTLVASLAGLGRPALGPRPARPLGSAWLLPQEQGPDLLPLELADAAGLPAVLGLAALETDFVLVDRFTGLHVKDSPWYRVADEVLLLVDGRPAMESRGLRLAGHVRRHWPGLPLHVLHTRMGGPFNWQTQSARFLRRLDHLPGAALQELGCLPEAPELQRARVEGKPFTRMYPNHPASRTLRQGARLLLRTSTARAWQQQPQPRQLEVR
jgi:hypothetical protein